MCGIVGYITSHKHPSAERRKFFEQALIIDTLRGEDSTGMIVVSHEQDKEHRDGCAGYGKMVSDGYGFVNSDTYKDVMGKGEWRAVIGHNRAATVGGVDIETAHPFNVGPITLVHNGTLKDMSHMKYSDYDKESHNDSHAIARNMAEAPPGAKSVIEDLDGAFTLVWHDARDDMIRIVRNKERPLHMAVSEQGNGSTLYFASEAGMLAWLLRRIGITHGPIFEPKPGKLMTFDRDPMAPKVESVDLYVPSWTYSWTPGKYKPVGFTAPPVNQQAPFVEAGATKVRVLGGTRELPAALKSDLGGFGLRIEEAVTFCPRNFREVVWSKDNNRALVGGELIDVSQQWHKITAVIHGVPPSVTRNHMSNMWTVRPMAVFFGEDWQPIVVCKLVSYTKAKCGSVVDIAYWDAIDKQRMEAEEVEDKWGDARYTGPHQAQLRADEWLQETSGGCAWCAKSLSLLDADEVEWVNEGTMPVCGDCIEDMASVVLN